MALRHVFPTPARQLARDVVITLFVRSLRAAGREQRLASLVRRLEHLVPHIDDQYSRFRVEGTYLETKVRLLHAFQVSLVERVIGEFADVTVVDIGDSSGTHLQYLRGLHPDIRVRCVSVNLDEKSIAKIRAKGLEAIHARAEELQRYHVTADIFLCFETMEHLMNPTEFLHELSSKTNARYLILTVPYVARSRVGMHHIRYNRRELVSAEEVHIVEFCPDDLRLLVQHCGWKTLYDQVYLQYPRYHPMRIMKPFWKRLDLEGFYGMILTRDDTWSRFYTDW